MTKIAINIINWQQAQLTIDTIESIKKIVHPNFSYHIYLIDSGSKDSSPNILSEKYASDKLVSFIGLDKNIGFSGCNNVGIKLALRNKFDYVLLINNDVIVDKFFLVHLLTPFKANSQIGVVGPKIYFAPGYEYQKNRYKKNELGKVIWSAGGAFDWNNIYTKNIGIDEVDSGQYDKPQHNMEFLTNCCVLIKTEVFKKVGLMPEDYFMYCEDADFCQQIYRQGYLLSYQPKSIIWHINSGSSSAGGGAFHDYFLTRNRLILSSKYASFRTKFALLRESVKLLFKGTPWQKRGVIDFYLGVTKKGSWQ